jgi:hypothetical protein
VAGSTDVDQARRASIAALWSWWSATGAGQAVGLITSGGPGSFAEEMTARLAVVDPRLQWELARGGAASEHALCISAGGLAELRGLAERCVRAAPAPSATWEYLPARRPDPGALSDRMRMGDLDVGFSELAVSLSLQARRHLLDLVVYHPDFAEMRSQDRTSVAFMALDRLLGEDGVERWLGDVTVATEPPSRALPLMAVRDAVAELEEREASEGPWVELKGKRKDGALAVIRARRPMRWVDHPTFEHHLVVRAPYKPSGADQQPDDGERERLGAMAQDLSEGLGKGGLLVADVRCVATSAVL